MRKNIRRTLLWIAFLGCSLVAGCSGGCGCNGPTDQGIRLLSQGNYDEAIAQFDEAIEKNPKDAYAYGNRAVAYLAKEDYERAIADNTKVIEMYPKSAPAYLNRAMCFRARVTKLLSKDPTADLQRALDDCNKVIELDSNLAAHVYVQRAYIHAENKDLDKAMGEAEKAVSLSAQSVAAYACRGFVRAEKGEFTKALSDYDQAILKATLSAKKRDRADLHIWRSYVFIKQGKAGPAIKDCESAMKLSPKIPGAYLNRGLARLLQGKENQAQTDFQNYVRLLPKSKKVMEKRIKEVRARAK